LVSKKVIKGTRILPVALYGSEAWPFMSTGRDELKRVGKVCSGEYLYKR
jgi:hypothetical protein